jgi:hypothetical protein
MNYSRLDQRNAGTPDLAAEIALFAALSILAFVFTLVIVLHALANNAMPVTQQQNIFAFDVSLAFGLATFGLSLIYLALESR